MGWGQRFKSRGMRQAFWLVTYAILLFCGLMNLDWVLGALRWMVALLTPLLVGILFVFLLNPTMKFFEKRLFRAPAAKMQNARVKARVLKAARPVSLTLAVLLFFLVIGGIVALVVPQCVASITKLVGEFRSYVDAFQLTLDELSASIPYNLNIMDSLDAWVDQALKNAGDFITNVLPQVFDITKTVTNFFVTCFLGLVLGIYILARKERHRRQVDMVLEAYLPPQRSERLQELSQFTVKTFESYILGQFTEALLLGVLCFIGMTIMGLPYALLISTFIGLTNMIPIVGPLLGVVPGALILLVIDPLYALWFLIFILVLQQVENNLIYPRVVGSQVGLSGIWVLLAVTIGGSAFGFVGILLAVPTMTVIYRVASENIHLRLRRRRERTESQNQGRQSGENRPE